MLAGVTIVDPLTTWIEPDRRARGGRDDPARSRSCAARRASRPAPRSARIRLRSTPTIGARCDRRAVLLPSPWNGPRRVLEGGHLRGDQELTYRRPHEGASPVVHRRRRHRRRTRTSAPARSRRTSPHRPGRAQGAARRSGATSGPASTMASSRPSEVGDGAWIAAGSVITQDVPADALGDRPPTPGEQGGVCSPSARRLSSFFPVSRRRSS